MRKRLVELKVILSLIAYALAFVVLTCIISLVIADKLAYRSACNTKQTDILELVIEHDNNAEIVAAHFNYKNGTGYLVLKNESEYIYTINVEVKQVAPFRYEWVEVDL